jgi:hypothetical protein
LYIFHNKICIDQEKNNHNENFNSQAYFVFTVID